MSRKVIRFISDDVIDGDRVELHVWPPKYVKSDDPAEKELALAAGISRLLSEVLMKMDKERAEATAS